MMGRTMRGLILIGSLLALGLAPPAASAAYIRWKTAVRAEPAKNGGLQAVSCPTAKLCVAVDDSGYVVTTINPTGGSGSWSHTAKIDSSSLTGVSCASTSFCVAVDAAGDVLTSTKPTGGAAAWSKPVHVDSTASPGGGYAGFAGIACPSTSLCVAVDSGTTGNVATSTKPTGGAHAWKLTALTGTLTSVSCASVTLCVAAGTQHLYSIDPTGGGTAWHATGGQTGGGILSGIACPSSTLCVGVGYGNTSPGLATASADPRGSAASWKTVGVEPTPPSSGQGLLDAVGCAGTALCVAVDSSDRDYVTTTAAAKASWTSGAPIRPNAASDRSAISCSATVCMVVDSAGVATAGVVHG